MDPSALIERVWPGRNVEVSTLGGGITNHNFRVDVDGEPFVLRVGGKDTDLLGIDRTAEVAAARMAASIGIGPEVVTVIEPEGYLVTRFIEAQPVPPETMRDPLMLAKVGVTIDRLHRGSSLPSTFDSHEVVRRYAATARERGVEPPADYGWALAIADRIREARGPAERRPCHNDLLNANFLRQGDRLWIVDWEYAGMGDPLFDLGNFSVKHDLGEGDERPLLVAYGLEDERSLSMVRLLRFMGAFFEAMWAVVQMAVSELDFDYEGYARDNFGRLHAIADDPDFERGLARPSP
jgi:thiamine kinase-like enzyme